MTAEGALGVAVDLDPAVWLPGPVADATEAERAEWVEGALAACCSDFRVPAGSAEERHLREVLTLFATSDLLSDFRFLRLRGIDDVPVVARLDVQVGVARGEVAEALESFDPDATPYDRQPRVEVLDAERGLRRSLSFQVDADDGLRAVVRYHRRVAVWDTDVVLSAGGADLKTTASALADLDALARAVWVLDEAGERR